MLLQDFNSSIGSLGIGIAILANGNPIGVIFAALLFGFLNVMGITMGRLPGFNIPSSIIDLIEGIVMICVIASYFLRNYVELRREKKLLKKESEQSCEPSLPSAEPPDAGVCITVVLPSHAVPAP